MRLTVRRVTVRRTRLMILSVLARGAVGSTIINLLLLQWVRKLVGCPR